MFDPIMTKKNSNKKIKNKPLTFKTERKWFIFTFT